MFNLFKTTKPTVKMKKPTLMHWFIFVGFAMAFVFHTIALVLYPKWSAECEATGGAMVKQHGFYSGYKCSKETK